MGNKKKKKNKKRNKSEQITKEKKVIDIEVDPPSQEILDSIGSPNAWTPDIEDAWLRELSKISAGEIYRRFPPIKKPPSVRKRGKSSGWGDSNV